MFLKGKLIESFSRVMEPTNGMRMLMVTGNHLTILANMRFLAIKSFCMTTEVIWI